MKVAIIFTLVFIMRGVVHSVPVICQTPITENLDPTNISNEDQDGTSNHKLVKKSTSELCPLDFQENSESSEDVQFYEEANNRLSLPTFGANGLPTLNTPHETLYLGDGMHDILTPIELKPSIQNIHPVLWDQQWSPYEMENQRNSDSFGIEESSYGGIYPYLNPEVLASMNPIPSVRSLPPVHSTHIHESIPAAETGASYDIEVLNPQDTMLLPTNVRPVRSRSEEFLAQLSHDAILNNILPTMPVPFVRNAMTPMYPAFHAVPAAGPILAVYPTGMPADCALPFLLDCSPKIARGTLTGHAYAGNPQLMIPAHIAGAYRTADHLVTNQNHDDSLMEVPMADV